MNQMFRNLFISKNQNVLIQLFRYSFVAAIGLVIDFGVLYLLTEVFHVYYLLSASVSFVLALIINYLLCVIWIFESSKNTWLEDLITFALIGLVGLILNILLIWLFTAVFHFFYLVSKAVSTVIVYLWNFFMRRALLFARAKS